MTIALSLFAGLVLLIVGGELLVRGSVRVAERLGVSPLLIGLTLVGFGTSTPEIVTSVQAAMIGSPGIAVGNIVGSNMANMLLILGVSALVYPMVVESRALKRDGLVVVVTALILYGVGLGPGLNGLVGLCFLLMLAAYLVYAYRQERTVGASSLDHTAAFGRAEAMEGANPLLRPQDPGAKGFRHWFVPIGIAVAGLAIIIFGGQLLVTSAVELARTIGLSETVIGLTIVAVGTSMPELITSLMAAIKRQSEVAIGNVLGSNIYNVLGIGGLMGLISPTAVPQEIVRVDAPLMVAVSILVFLFAWTGRRLSRREGLLLALLYALYTGWLIAGS